MFALRLFITLMLLSLALGKPSRTESSDVCELDYPETMHDFCCELHEESTSFMHCQLEWHEKIHYTTAQEEQTYMFCAAECAFNDTELLGNDRKSLNIRHLRQHLENELGNDADEKLLYQTYIKCSKHALDLLKHKSVRELSQRLAKYKCHVYSGLVLECVANEMILHCPTGRFHNTPQCQETRSQLSACMQHIKYKP